MRRGSFALLGLVVACSAPSPAPPAPSVDVVDGLHVWAGLESGTLGYRAGPALAAVDSFEILVQGR